MDSMLRQLPESQREVIVMLKVSGMSIEEVARQGAGTHRGS
jgi:DNA-directed RNA polymerase specialized sigma24 family protein